MEADRLWLQNPGLLGIMVIFTLAILLYLLPSLLADYDSEVDKFVEERLKEQRLSTTARRHQMVEIDQLRIHAQYDPEKISPTFLFGEEMKILKKEFPDVYQTVRQKQKQQQQLTLLERARYQPFLLSVDELEIPGIPEALQEHHPEVLALLMTQKVEQCREDNAQEAV